MKLKAFLIDAQKACGAVVVAAGAAVVAGLVDNAQAAEITGGAGVVAAVCVYLLGDLGKPNP